GGLRPGLAAHRSAHVDDGARRSWLNPRATAGPGPPSRRRVQRASAERGAAQHHRTRCGRRPWLLLFAGLAEEERFAALQQDPLELGVVARGPLLDELAPGIG